jgi:meso-butanediol dehydrogenase / (S,S)-butanediol dehydrogenase / diacetyl reductase
MLREQTRAKMEFEGKICVVTGAASGIGLSTAKLLADRGAKLLLVDRDASYAQPLRERFADPGIVDQVVGDVGEQSTWAAVLDASRRMGVIDVLINCAGYGIQGTVLDLELGQWEGQFRTNVTGTFLGCQAVLPQMIEHGRGTIVNVASVAGSIGMAKRAAYCASKSAVIGLTRAMAVDHARQGIRINAVAPGTTDSPYFDRIAADLEDPIAYRAYLADRQILGRMGTPEEIAAAIIFLASEAASFAIGSVLTVDGGMSVW